MTSPSTSHGHATSSGRSRTSNTAAVAEQRRAGDPGTPASSPRARAPSHRPGFLQAPTRTATASPALSVTITSKRAASGRVDRCRAGRRGSSTARCDRAERRPHRRPSGHDLADPPMRRSRRSGRGARHSDPPPTRDDQQPSRDRIERQAQFEPVPLPEGAFDLDPSAQPSTAACTASMPTPRPDRSLTARRGREAGSKIRRRAAASSSLGGGRGRAARVRPPSRGFAWDRSRAVVGERDDTSSP
jgi:hypothetical protein